MKNILWIAAGGALGAGLRYGLILLSPFGAERIFFVIMCENIAGSFLLGLLLGMISKKVIKKHPWGSFLGTGLLGSFTTFSTFSLDLIQVASLNFGILALYGITSLVGGLAAAFCGLRLGTYKQQ